MKMPRIAGCGVKLNATVFLSAMNFLQRFVVFNGLLFATSLILWPGTAQAQTGTNPLPGDSARLLGDVRQQIARGRSQFDSNEIESIATLRNAAQQALSVLMKVTGPEILTTAPDEMPQVGFLGAATRQTAEAHYWWGRAADQFGRRDEAVAALARAARFAGKVRPSSLDTLARDSLLALSSALRDGLPEVAADDTLTTVAEISHGKLWQPRRFTFDFSSVQLATGGSASGSRQEFLLTSGRLYPPVSMSAAGGNALSRVPPIYRNVDAVALPEVVRHDRMVIGYARERTGPNQGLWRQVVRAFYASSHLTDQNRDDRLRAEALCAQFLKVHAMYEAALGLKNPYTRDGITTLWLSELSALWPRDDDDPRVRATMGTVMPGVNTPISPGNALGENLEITVTPTISPWRVGAGQSDSAPGDIIFFDMAQTRSEFEWLRELMHEYGHVALPAINGFKPPLEPYANGLMGETLCALWALSSPANWNVPAELGKPDDTAKFREAVQSHVEKQALNSLQVWNARGPVSPLRRDSGANGLTYLQGATVYIERVYGADILGAAMAPLVEKSAGAPDALARLTALNGESLLAALPAVLRDPFSKNGAPANSVLPIWLPGALSGIELSTAQLALREKTKLNAGQTVTAWLYLPPQATSLRIEWNSSVDMPNSLSFDANSRITSVKPQSGAEYAASLDVRNRSGWQKFTLTAKTTVELAAAQFEKTGER